MLDDESFHYTILHCSTKVQPHPTHLSGVDDIGPDALLWPSVPLLKLFVEYIYATGTGFPPPMFRIHPSTGTLSAKDYPESDTAPLRPDAHDVESASPAPCAS